MHHLVGRYIGILLCAVALTGCAHYRAALEDTATFIKEIDGQGCICLNAVGGGGFGATVNGAVSGFASHGGIDPQVCLEGCLR